MDRQIRDMMRSTGQGQKEIGGAVEGRTDQRTKNNRNNQEKRRRNWPRRIWT